MFSWDRKFAASSNFSTFQSVSKRSAFPLIGLGIFRSLDNQAVLPSLYIAVSELRLFQPGAQWELLGYFVSTYISGNNEPCPLAMFFEYDTTSVAFSESGPGLSFKVFVSVGH